jgi:hypothetical protein
LHDGGDEHVVKFGIPQTLFLRLYQLKAQFQLVKMLRNKSGWGWNDEDKHVVVDDAYVECI